MDRDVQSQVNIFDLKLWSSFWHISKPYWFGDEKRRARLLTMALALLLVGFTGMNLTISYAVRDFMTALAERDLSDFNHSLLVCLVVFVVATPVSALFDYVRRLFGINWRQWLTTHYLSGYFGNRAYYQINDEPEIDNPDQRISQDINSFTSTSLDFFIEILNALIQLLAFIAVLWSISRLLVYILVTYAVIGTIVVALFGKKLVGLNFLQLRSEADFRYGLVHVRNNTESIAFYRGEQQENDHVLSRFDRAVINFQNLIKWQRNLAFFTYGYQYFIQVLPFAVMAPLYFDQQIKFGVITQAATAFSAVLASLTIIVSKMESLSQFAAGITRLQSFKEALLQSAGESLTLSGDSLPVSSRIGMNETGRLALENVTLMTPHGEQTLLVDATAEVPSGGGLIIVGPSGAGKSSILRAFAGLWTVGSGVVHRPPVEQILFLPQRPYMILGSLRDQLIYPGQSGPVSDEVFLVTLDQVNLSGLVERVGGLDAVQPWGEFLSLGEQQRLSFARLLLTQPRYAILDEATSALDVHNEARLYEYMLGSGMTFISVGHRPNLVDYHDSVLELMGSGAWVVRPAKSA
ncbi:MAG: ABC transporter ATP-binding protein/permease [Chlorobiaceae bacterium]|nr:ABC transporter ATP-binding protein/permease [Chlorobiaceae bacterium]